MRGTFDAVRDARQANALDNLRDIGLERQRIGRVVTEQQIVTVAPIDCVVASLSEDDVVAATATQNVATGVNQIDQNQAGIPGTGRRIDDLVAVGVKGSRGQHQIGLHDLLCQRSRTIAERVAADVDHPGDRAQVFQEHVAVPAAVAVQTRRTVLVVGADDAAGFPIKMSLPSPPVMVSLPRPPTVHRRRFVSVI